MESVYERAYQQMLQEGVEDDDAIEFVNILYDEEALHDLDENAAFKLVSGISRATGLNKMSTVNSLRFLKGMVGPGFSKALQRRMSGVILKSPPKPPPLPEPIKGTPVQTSIFSKSGNVKDFSGGKTPFPGPGPAFQGPKPAATTPTVRSTQSPGQLQIPGTSNRAQELRNVTRNPNTGLPGASNTGLTAGDSSLGGYGARTLNSQPLRRTPNIPTPPKVTPKNLFGRLTSNRYVKAAVSAVPFVLGTDALIRGDQSIIGRQMRSGPELTPEIIKGVQQREKLAQQSAETKASNTPTPTPTGERSASANTTKQEVAKTGAERRRAAAASFDKEFAAARAAGKDVFTWRGKQYNTKLK